MAELVELKKIRKAVEGVREKAKKIKFKDLLDPKNINERINAFLDKLTLDDAIKLTAFISAIYLIYPVIYRLRTPEFWKSIPPLFPWFWPGFGYGPTPEDVETALKEKFEVGALAVTMIVAYGVIWKDKEIVAYGNMILSALSGLVS